ncbi:hypothetical protein A2164_00245 [Candidatus Curtissbacteria bacterium RBG_13_35_7]|uniref:Glycosyltransferase 2-like domain-containing protein n=1 Tax=Candidatus Curtissbacteria bacterium RBG_13_35_7 TaxID=1797705 RepID=A0A1F5G1S9_9BACT|nr:MAG: hypothetical protein A2164_00245 [Candidatus Curtissbacteria bacterium RBG_13_35_7]
MKPYPKITIIFPNYNGGNEPIECLKSIKKLSYPQKNLEVIIVDNDSKDGSKEEIEKKFPEVYLIKNSKNLGFAKAINQGIKRANGKLIFVANDDLVFEKNSLKILVDYLLQNSQIGIMGGKIFSKHKPAKITSAGYQMNRWTGKINISKNYQKIKEPDWIQGCAILINKKVFQNIGYFDENFTHFFEDFDFCFHAKKAKFKVIYLPRAVFWHGESITANKNKPLKYFNWYKSKILFLIKNLPIVNILSILTVQILLITPYRALILRDGRFKPFLKALIWNLKNAKTALKIRKSSSILEANE